METERSTALANEVLEMKVTWDVRWRWEGDPPPVHGTIEDAFDAARGEATHTGPFPIWVRDPPMKRSYFTLEGFSHALVIAQDFDPRWRSELAGRFPAHLWLSEERVRELVAGDEPSEDDLGSWHNLLIKMQSVARRLSIFVKEDDVAGAPFLIVLTEWEGAGVPKLVMGPFATEHGLKFVLDLLASDWERWTLTVMERTPEAEALAERIRGVLDTECEIKWWLEPLPGTIASKPEKFAQLSSEQNDWLAEKLGEAHTGSGYANDKLSDYSVEEWISKASDSAPFAIWRGFAELRDSSGEAFVDDSWVMLADVFDPEWRAELTEKYAKPLKLSKVRQRKLTEGAELTERELEAWEELISLNEDSPMVIRVYRISSEVLSDEAFMVVYEEGAGQGAEPLLEIGPLRTPEGVAKLIAPEVRRWDQWGDLVESADPRAAEFGRRLRAGLGTRQYIEGAFEP